MLFHMSIPCRDPKRSALVIAELWRGEAFPFPHNRNESWVAFAGDDRATAIECYPYASVISPSTDNHPVGFVVHQRSSADLTPLAGRGAVHAAIGTPLSLEEIVAIGDREGWLARFARRGLFSVVELWLDNETMLEVLTADQQKQYLESQTLDAWRMLTQKMSGQQLEQVP